VQLFSWYHSDNHLNILLELMDAGSLSDCLQLVKKVPEPALGRIAYFCVEALRAIRLQHYLHRDLKPSNILLSKSGAVKIGDFGLATQLQVSVELKASYLGTAIYMSPERIQGGEYGLASEIWAIGLILYECALGSHPFATHLTESVIWEIIETIEKGFEINLPKEYSPQLVDLLRGCLAVRPNDRLTIEQVQAHPWVKKFAGADAQKPLLDWMAEVDRTRQARATSLAESRETSK
jgi:serine/threonine protein kinase